MNINLSFLPFVVMMSSSYLFLNPQFHLRSNGVIDLRVVGGKGGWTSGVYSPRYQAPWRRCFEEMVNN